MPLCSASFVLRPIARPGASSAICGSFAVRPISASIETVNARRDRDAEIFAGGGDRDEHGRRAEAHDDERRAEALAAADRRGDEIGADLGRILGHDRHQALRLRFQEDAASSPKKRSQATLEHRIELRHDARNRDRIDRARLDVARREELREEDAVLVGRAPQLGRDAPRLLQLASSKSSRVSSRCCRRRSSGASHQLLDRVEQARGQRRLAGAAQLAAAVIAPEQHERVIARAEPAFAAHVVDGDRVEMLRAQLLARARLVLVRFGREADQEVRTLALARAPRERRGWAPAVPSDPRRVFFSFDVGTLRGTPVGDRRRGDREIGADRVLERRIVELARRS